MKTFCTTLKDQKESQVKLRKEKISRLVKLLSHYSMLYLFSVKPNGTKVTPAIGFHQQFVVKTIMSEALSMNLPRLSLQEP